MALIGDSPKKRKQLHHKGTIDYYFRSSKQNSLDKFLGLEETKFKEDFKEEEKSSKEIQNTNCESSISKDLSQEELVQDEERESKRKKIDLKEEKEK